MARVALLNILIYIRLLIFIYFQIFFYQIILTSW